MSKSSRATQKPVLVAAQSLGCAKNLVDTEVMCGLLSTAGYVMTDDLEAADALLINTCGFIQSARDEAADAIRQGVAWKKAGAAAGRRRILIVGGCLAQRSPQACAEAFPEVDCLMGIDAVPQVADIIGRLLAAEAAPAAPLSVHSDGAPRYLYDEETPRMLCTPSSYAYVKIAEGCNHRCAFCAIPGIRGNLRSRPLESVLTECRRLIAQGVPEIDLIAQDSTAYGVDQRDPGRLSALLKKLDALEGDFWVRVLYTHPLHLTDEFIGLLGASPNSHIVPYLDVPLQHISNPLLASMRRGMTEAQTRERMAAIRARFPHLAIRTTFMTGYPGETEEDFQKLLDFVKEFRFDRLGAFAFSPEEGTPAAAITEGRVPPEVARQRLDRLMRLQRQLSRKRNLALVGQRLRVLVEERLEDGAFVGRTAADAPEVDQTIRITVPPKGRRPRLDAFADVAVTAAGAYDLTAETAP